jgi:hypothetical protein
MSSAAITDVIQSIIITCRRPQEQSKAEKSAKERPNPLFSIWKIEFSPLIRLLLIAKQN